MVVAGAVDPTTPAGPAGPDAASERAQARKEFRRLLFRRPGFIIGLVIVTFWLICTVAAESFVPYDAFDDFSLGHQPPSHRALVRDGSPWP